MHGCAIILSVEIAKTFIGRAPNQSGVDTILYLRNVPAKAPTANNMNGKEILLTCTGF
jgi:hypothetical protein